MPIKLHFQAGLLPLLLFSVGVVAHCAMKDPQNLSSATTPATSVVYSDSTSLGAELQRLGTAIANEKTRPERLARLREGLPTTWEVTTPEQRFSISTGTLRKLLEDAEKEKKPEQLAGKVAAAADWVFDLADQLKEYDSTRTRNRLDARKTLDQILSEREFNSVHAPSVWDLFTQRVERWIVNLLEALFGRIRRYPVGATILMWAVIVGVVLWLAVTLLRYWSRRTSLENLQAPESVAYMRTWQEWIHAAREAAARGDYREAVHSTYWAGIAYLEETGAVRKDRARTPREYVRSVSTAGPLPGPGLTLREALSALTLVLEQVWYGRRPASDQDYAKAMQSVEALGCQLQ